MSEVGHDLHSAFPADGEILRILKHEAGYFQTLWRRHHVLAQDICRIEDGRAAASDECLEEMKKRRLAILDGIAGLIAERKAA